MLNLTPEEQACLEWVYRSATDAMGKLVFVSETGQVWARGEQFFLDPNSTFHGWIALLAQAAECHLAGMKPGEQRRNLLTAGVREWTTRVGANALPRSRLSFKRRVSGLVAQLDSAAAF